MQAANLTKDDEVLIESVEIADTFLSRFLGMMGRGPLGPGRALHIIPCGSVQTFFMTHSLDLVFLDSANTVVKIVRGVTPFRIVFGGTKAQSVMELTAGWFVEDALRVGDEVSLSPARPHQL